jgi:hypothetical protein
VVGIGPLSDGDFGSLLGFEMIAEVEWRNASKAGSIRELDDILNAIAKEVSSELPQAVHVTRTNGDCLSIVLGSKEGSILNFIAKSGDPPYFVSLGDPKAIGVFTFYIAPDHHSEALAANVVSEVEARQAIREFVSHSHGLPSNINWTEV